MNKPGSNSLTAVLKDHRELDNIFHSHQRALLARDIDSAVGLLTKFQDSLERHIRYEEDVLLPLYVQKHAETEGGTLKIFQSEHRRLKELTDKLTQMTARLYGAPDLMGGILEIFDKETMFKGLFSHHATREQNILFPRLDAFTTATERAKLLGQHVH
jgi:iron-sulfur cluster repair protein YtfE (RIC family)